MITSPYHIVPYARRYRRDLMGLLANEDRLHIHLDWNTVDEWLNEPDVPIFLAWNGKMLVGAIAAAPPLEHATWIRLIVLSEEIPAQPVLAELWSALRVDLLSRDVTQVAILLLRSWISAYIGKLGFQPMESIVTLRRDGIHIPKPLRSDVYIRRAELRDVPTAVDIDHAAFGPIWQLNEASLRQAARVSARFSFAELDGEVVGYELSTLYRDGGHLARLATLPDIQGAGVGGVMLGAMIESFLERGVRSVTVNTQKSNMKSIHLYKRYGFEPTGLDMDVWSLEL